MPTPAVIVFDLADMSGSPGVSLLRSKPEIILIGLDISSDDVLALSSHAAQMLNITALELI